MAGHAADMHQIRLDLCRRAVEHAKHGSTDMATGTMYNDVSVYTDPARHALELQKLFHEMPQVVCLSVDLPQPGSFRLFDDLGVPILVQRGQDGAVRAFLNICPHRGARLVREAEGCAKRHSCRFHGWTFDTEGRAGAVPQEKHFCGPIGNHKQLVAVPAEERHGLVFVQATPGATMDLEAHLGAVGAELDKLDLDQAERVREGDLHASCNWKYAMDTYFENYHFATLHRNSIGPLFANNLILYDTWGPHHRVVFPPRETWEWAKKPESEWLIDTLGTPYFIFPNTIIYNGSLRPDSAYLTLFRIYPRAVGELVTRTGIYAPGGVRSEAQRQEVHDALDGILSLVQNEDYDVTGESWKNFLALPPGSRVVYGRQELAVQHTHRWYARAVGLPEPDFVPTDDAVREERLRA